MGPRWPRWRRTRTDGSSTRTAPSRPAGTTLTAPHGRGWRGHAGRGGERPRATAPRLALRAPARVAGGRRIPLSLEVPADGPVALELFDVQGRRVTHAQTTRLSIGHQELTWDVGSLPAAGLYLLRVAQGGQSAVARTMLLH